jgi:hypothetical protein
VYRGAIPSSTRIHESEEANALLADFCSALEICLKKKRPHEYGRTVFYVASWLYSNCPNAIIEAACNELKRYPPVNTGALAVAGNCFNRKPELQIFFQELSWCVQNVSEKEFPPRDWLRAYRNIARLRANALELDVLDRETQSVILGWYIDVFEKIVENPRSQIFGSCVYLAPHLLKRRRFDREFIANGDPDFQRFEGLLKLASSNAHSPKHRDNAKCALEFLHKTATEATLETLGQIID